MEPYFIATDVTLLDRIKHTEKIPLPISRFKPGVSDGFEEGFEERYHQTVKVMVELTSSGNTEIIASEDIMLRILKALEHV